MEDAATLYQKLSGAFVPTEAFTIPWQVNVTSP